MSNEPCRLSSICIEDCSKCSKSLPERRKKRVFTPEKKRISDKEEV